MMFTRLMPTRRSWLLPALLLAALGCSNAGENFGFGANSSGVVGVLVFLDRDGSLDASAADTALAGVQVGLVIAGGTDTVFQATTDANGNVIFRGLPLGDYRLVVDTTTIGDSVDVQAIDSSTVTLRNNDPQQTVTVRVGFPTATVAEARLLAVQTRVFVKGVLLVDPSVFGDTTAHLRDGTAAIRLTNATNAGPLTNISDSVRVLATVDVRSGQPVLNDARINIYDIGPQPTPVNLTTAEARTADGGTRDAELVHLTSAVLVDTLTDPITGDYRVTLDDGTDTVTMVIDDDLNLPVGPFTPGKVFDGDGVLVPTGAGSWVFKPRGLFDITLT